MASALSKIQHIAPGNSNVAHLGSMAIFDRNEADRIAIQIASDAAPGYLRGQIYGDFGEARWNALRRGVAASPLSAGAPPGYRPVLPGERLFSVAPGDTLAGSMEIYPDSAIQNALFIPLYTGWIGMATDEIVVDKSGIAQVLDNLNGRPFRALLSNPPPRSALRKRQGCSPGSRIVSRHVCANSPRPYAGNTRVRGPAPSPSPSISTATTSMPSIFKLPYAKTPWRSFYSAIQNHPPTASTSPPGPPCSSAPPVSQRAMSPAWSPGNN